MKLTMLTDVTMPGTPMLVRGQVVDVTNDIGVMLVERGQAEVIIEQKKEEIKVAADDQVSDIE